MFNVGFGELVFILSIALLVLGPRKLPELARGLGRFLREFRRQSEDIRQMVEREFYKLDRELEEPLPRQAPPEGTFAIPPLHHAPALPGEDPRSLPVEGEAPLHEGAHPGAQDPHLPSSGHSAFHPALEAPPPADAPAPDASSPSPDRKVAES